MKKYLLIIPIVIMGVFVSFNVSLRASSYEVSTNIYTGTVNVDNEFKITYDLATYTSITGRQVIEELFGMIDVPTEVTIAIYDMPLSSVYISTTAEYLAYTNVDLMIIKVYTSLPLYLLNVDINLFDDTGNKIVTKTYTNGLPQGFQLLAQSYGLNEPSGSYQGGYDDGYIDGKDYYGYYINGIWLTADEYGNIRFGDGYDAGLTTNLDVKPLFSNLLNFIGNIFSLTIFPGMTIGALISIPIAFALFKWFMKMFGGGR